MSVSVERTIAAMLAAFCKAERVTFTGSTIPALNMSTYSPVSASKPYPRGLRAHGSNGHSAIAASVDGNLAQWLFQGTAQDVDTGLLVAGSNLHVVQHRNSGNQHGTTTGDDTLFDSGASRGERILDAVLLLFHLHFGSGANLNDADAASQFRQTLLQLLAIIVTGGLFDLSANLAHASLQLLLAPVALNDGRVIFVGRHTCARDPDHAR